MRIKQLARIVVCASIVAIFVVSAAWTMNGPTLSASQKERFDRLTHQLIAPCCWREPIAIHQSTEALQMLDEVEQFVTEGRSEEEIKSIYVNRYGMRILADPSGAQGRWLYIIPVVLFFGAVLVAAFRLHSLVFRASLPKPSVPPELIARIRMESDRE